MGGFTEKFRVLLPRTQEFGEKPADLTEYPTRRNDMFPSVDVRSRFEYALLSNVGGNEAMVLVGSCAATCAIQRLVSWHVPGY